ncbi:MAG: hypothetical protein ACLQNE_47060 [Thermoguttaceae bacterium]
MDTETCYDVSLVIEFSGSIIRLGVMLRRDDVPLSERVDLERLRLYAIRERVAAVRRIMGRRPDKGGMDQDGGMLALFGGGLADYDLDAGRPSTGQ